MSKKLQPVSHLDAVQGSNSDRMSRTKGTVNERQRQPDAVMRQKQFQKGELCSTLRSCGG